MKLEYESIYLDLGDTLEPEQIIDLYKAGYEFFYEVETGCDFRLWLASTKKVSYEKMLEIYDRDMEKEFAKMEKEELKEKLKKEQQLEVKNKENNK